MLWPSCCHSERRSAPNFKLYLTVGEGLDELVRVLVVHAVLIGEQVEVRAHALDGAAQLAVLELEVVAPEVEELLHLVLRQLTL